MGVIFNRSARGGNGNGKCPIDHNNTFVEASKKQSCPYEHQTPQNGNEDPPKVYNVYGQLIDPTNQMPVNPNQLPLPGQQKHLPTDRIKSTIPKGGTNDTWTYPSPQMFYNSLIRKEKDSNLEQDEMTLLVAIHNNMNEHTWQEIMRWEGTSTMDCPISLLKFHGRPHDHTPTAKLWHWLGRPLPFDRHDWIVDRCGTQIRYVIDYYYQQGGTPPQQQVGTHGSRVSDIVVHVRPALDSFTSLWNRIQARVNRTLQKGPRKGGYTSPPSLTPTPSPTQPLEQLEDWDKITPEEYKFLSKLDLDQVEETRGKLEKTCGGTLRALRNSMELEQSDPNDYARYALSYCVGQFVCPQFSENWFFALNNPTSTEEEVVRAFRIMEGCVWRYACQAQRVLDGAGGKRETTGHNNEEL